MTKGNDARPGEVPFPETPLGESIERAFGDVRHHIPECEAYNRLVDRLETAVGLDLETRAELDQAVGLWAAAEHRLGIENALEFMSCEGDETDRRIDELERFMVAITGVIDDLAVLAETVGGCVERIDRLERSLRQEVST